MWEAAGAAACALGALGCGPSLLPPCWLPLLFLLSAGACLDPSLDLRLAAAGTGGDPADLIAASICSLILGLMSRGSSFSTAGPTLLYACASEHAHRC